MFLFIVISNTIVYSQNKNAGEKYAGIDPAPFESSSHHWYDIFDRGNVINAKPNQPRYKTTEITNVADNILLYQKENGGWPKNYDMFAILTAGQKDSLLKVKKILNTTFDNSTTYTQVECLARVYFVTKIKKYKDACLKGIDYILSAQYKNGGWPQYYPLEKNYSRYITFNDDVMSGIMEVFKDVIDGKEEYFFIDKEHRKKIKAAFDKGLNCILRTQINDDGVLTAWCQQYDENHLKPAWARAFEPPAICNNESAGVVLLLMNIENPSREIIQSIRAAVKWFNDSKILNTRVKTIAAPLIVYKYRISKTDRIVVNDSSAPPVWARYYELKTHRPLFCNRDSKVVYSLAEVDRERRDGYGWYNYEPQKVLNAYSAWQERWLQK